MPYAAASNKLCRTAQIAPANKDWTQGLECVWKMVALSIPPAIAFGIPMRRGAPTNQPGTALAAGLSAAGWGAFVFVFACPSDDPLYIAVWYTLDCGLVHPRVHDCDHVRTGCVAEVVAMVRPSDYDQFWDTGHIYRNPESRARAARVSLGQ